LIGYKSQQPYFGHLIADLLDESPLEGAVYLAKAGVVIDATGDEAGIDAFSTLLQNALPFSIHLGTVEPIEALPEGARPLGGVRRLPRGLFILPRTAQQLLNHQSDRFFDLFIDDSLNPPITRAWLEEAPIKAPREAFEKLADRLIQNGSVVLQSARGNIRLALSGHEDETTLEALLITHTRFLDRTHADDRLYALLSAIEKPAIRTPVEGLADRFGGAALLQLPYDLVTMLLSRALQDHDIDHLYLSPAPDTAPLLRYEGGVQEARFLELVIKEDGLLMIDGAPLPVWLQGPACEERGLKAPLAAVYEEGKIVLDHAERLSDRAHTTQAEGEDEPAAAMLSVLIEHGCVQENAVGGHLSLMSDESALLAWVAKERRFKPIATFAPLPEQGSETIGQIRNLNESAQTLLDNIAKSYPDLLTKIENYHFKGAAPLRLFALLGLLLGFDSRLSERDLFNRLVHLSLNPACHGGVKIDFKLNADRQIDWMQTARTVLSFRMAGVEPAVLAVSLFESFCDLLVMQLGDMRIALQTPHVAITGDLLAAPVLRQKLQEHFGRFFKLHMSRDLDTRSAAAVGALYLG
jgi:hypothetical protein